MVGTCIVVGNEKGGGSKSTVVATLAAHLSHRGYSVAILDCDPAKRISVWHNIHGHGTDYFNETLPKRLRDKIVELQKGYEVVFVDTAGAETAANQVAASMADLAILPCASSELDRAGVREFRDIVQTAEGLRGREIPTAVLLVRMAYNTKSGSVRTEIGRDCIDALEKEDFAFLDGIWPYATAFEQMWTTGDYPRRGAELVMINKTIANLIELGAVPPKPSKKGN